MGLPDVQLAPTGMELANVTRALRRGFKVALFLLVPLLATGIDGCQESTLGPGEVGTATCLACHDGRSASDHREFSESPHQAISCESCHGPGLNHVRNGGRHGFFIDNPGNLPFEKRHEACAECHAQANSPGGNTVQGFLSTAHFSGNGATCTDCHDVHKQGGMAISSESPSRFGSENFAKLCGQCHEDSVAQFAMSGHAVLDVATCASCHDMHTGEMFVASPEDNRLCLQCHQSFALGFETDEDVAFHTGHPVDPAGSGASRCTGCHMPPLESGGASGYDHTLFTIPPIASNEAVAEGVSPAPPNSCAGVTGCHDANVPGSGPAYDETDLDSNRDLQALYELIGALP
jgi:predicted CXXCH cytochrome family protein